MTSLANTEPSDKLECKLNILKVHYNCIHLNLDSNFFKEVQHQIPEEQPSWSTRTYLMPRMPVIIYQALMFVIGIW